MIRSSITSAVRPAARFATGQPGTTQGPDTVPNLFSFAPLTDVTPGQVVTSALVTPTGYDIPVPVGVAGAEVRIYDAADQVLIDWAGSATIAPGQKLQLRLTAPAQNGATVQATVAVGGRNATWSVTTTVPVDTMPDAFAFTDLAGQAVASLVASDIVTLSGFNATLSVSVDTGAFRILDAGDQVLTDWTTQPANISEGQKLQLRQTTAPTGDSPVSITVTVGTVTATWTVISAYDLRLAEGVATVTDVAGDVMTLSISGHSVAGYNGEHVTSKAAVDAGLPVVLVDPVLSESPAGTFTATPALALWQSADPGVSTIAWHRAGGPIAGATGVAYTLQSPADDGQLVEMVETLTNAAGSVERRVVAQAASGFAPNSVRFDGASSLSLPNDLGSGSDTTVMLFASFVVNQTNVNQAIFALDNSSNYVRINSNGRMRVIWYREDGALALFFETATVLTPGDLVNLLLIHQLGGRSHVVVKIGANAPVIERNQWDGTTGQFLETSTGAVAIGATANGGNQIQADMRRIAVWTAPLSAPDIKDSVVQAEFYAPDGTIKDPAVTHAAYGQPNLDFTGDAAALNAGQHGGTLPDFTAAGTFTDV